MHMRLPDATTYDISVERGEQHAVTLDGEPGSIVAGVLVVPLVRDGGHHVVRATLGRGRGRGKGG
jgi:hypothetical protein